MKTKEYSATELELAAEEILAELEGWERTTSQQRQTSIEQASVERFIRMMVSAAEQITAERRGESINQKSSAMENRTIEENNAAEKRRRADAEAQSSISDVFEQTEAGTQEVMRDTVSNGDYSLQLRNHTGMLQSVHTEEAAPVRQVMPFGRGQQQLHAISDWIERDSRRYDSGFPIL